jgi:7-alpha-hydroxysteroid dehydrogenase
MTLDDSIWKDDPLRPEAFRLDARVAVVTGAARGLGRAAALGLARFGADVAICDRDEEGLASCRSEIEALGRRCHVGVLDVREEDSVREFMAAVKQALGSIDVLVNNAGGGGHVPTKHANEEHFDAAIGLNFRAPFYMSRAVAPHMKSAGGAILNISSGYSRAANIGSIPYGGAKAALEQMTRMMAMEYAPQIRVNAIRVGAVTTENMKANLLAAMPGIGEKLAAWTPLQRLGEPRDIARAALFLCSPASDYITARILPVDGGVVLERSAMEIIDRAGRMDDQG